MNMAAVISLLVVLPFLVELLSELDLNWEVLWIDIAQILNLNEFGLSLLNLPHVENEEEGDEAGQQGNE